MNVVGHQHVGVDGTTTTTGGFQQIAPVSDMVSVGKEARLPVVAALDDVLRNAGEIEAGKRAMRRVPGNRKGHSVAGGTMALRAVDRDGSRRQLACRYVGKMNLTPFCKASGGLRRPRQLDVANCDFKLANSAAVVPVASESFPALARSTGGFDAFDVLAKQVVDQAGQLDALGFGQGRQP
ncbi:MAG: hypothetical protein ACREP2_10575 [Rhodanobacteraceae bacterium]